jgi:hypothetical protein
MINEEPKTRYEKPVIVAGIWHYTNITVENQESQELKLILYQGTLVPAIGERDERNYYEWNYNEQNKQWTDVNEYGGYTYIKNSSSIKRDSTYSFCIGIKDTLPSTVFYHENWTLEIYLDENKIQSQGVIVEKPTAALARSHASIIEFNIDPFTKMSVNASDDDYFILENTGNVPLDITIDFGLYNDYIKTTGFNKTLSSGTLSTHRIAVNSESWKPGIREIIGTITGTLSNRYVIPTANFTLISSQEINSPELTIFVGHSNYTISLIVETDIVFQRLKNLEMAEGQIKNISVYVSGNGTVTLDIWSDETAIRILKLLLEGNEVVSPFTFVSTDTKELNITIRVEAMKENKVGLIYYNLYAEGKNQSFQTRINIGSPLTSQESKGILTVNNIMVVIVILVVIIVIGYMVSSSLKHRRR